MVAGIVWCSLRHAGGHESFHAGLGRRGPLQLRPFFGLLPVVMVMAMSIGILALTSAGSLRQILIKWCLGLDGAALVGFALAFFAFYLRWFSLEDGSFFLLQGSYFAFGAICMLALALRVDGPRVTSALASA
jgi:hypothetical protein